MQPKYASWELIGLVLDRVIKNMESLHSRSIAALHFSSRFNSVRVPGISIRSYIARIQQYADCSDPCYVLAFIYLDRVLQNEPNFVLSMRNVHRLLLSAVVLAIKYLDDSYASNLTYAAIGGVSLAELNTLEVEMLRLLRYSLYVSSGLYLQYIQELDLQCQKILSETQSQEEVMNYDDECSKPIKTISSTTSIRTIPSFNEMVEL